MQKYRKFIVALIGAIGVAVSDGLLPSSWGAYVTMAIAALTALGVYQVPNQTP